MHAEKRRRGTAEGDEDEAKHGDLVCEYSEIHAFQAGY